MHLSHLISSELLRKMFFFWSEEWREKFHNVSSAFFSQEDLQMLLVSIHFISELFGKIILTIVKSLTYFFWESDWENSYLYTSK